MLSGGSGPDDGLDFPGQGDLVDGVRFFGEVSASEFPSMLNRGSGTLLRRNEPWLHFEIDGKTLYIARRPLKCRNIRSNLPTGTQLTHSGRKYILRLMTGNPGSTSEWGRLFYKIVRADPGLPDGYWPLYTVGDLGAGRTDGGMSWCMESVGRDHGGRTTYRMRGGSNSLTYATANANINSTDAYGWRPVLELVE